MAGRSVAEVVSESVKKTAENCRFVVFRRYWIDDGPFVLFYDRWTVKRKYVAVGLVLYHRRLLCTDSMD